jgi:hypothetical protein
MRPGLVLVAVALLACERSPTQGVGHASVPPKASVVQVLRPENALPEVSDVAASSPPAAPPRTRRPSPPVDSIPRMRSMPRTRWFSWCPPAQRITSTKVTRTTPADAASEDVSLVQAAFVDRRLETRVNDFVSARSVFDRQQGDLSPGDYYQVKCRALSAREGLLSVGCERMVISGTVAESAWTANVWTCGESPSSFGLDEICYGQPECKASVRRAVESELRRRDRSKLYERLIEQNTEEVWDSFGIEPSGLSFFFAAFVPHVSVAGSRVQVDYDRVPELQPWRQRMRERGAL